MESKFQPYRQPMITVTGILLGFALNLAANWVQKGFSTDRFSEYVIAVSLCLHIPLYIVVLYRILTIDIPEDKAASYYRRSLLLLIIGTSIYFLSIVIIMVESYMLHNH